MMPLTKQIKCVIVGDEYVRFKTQFICWKNKSHYTICTNHFYEDRPNVFWCYDNCYGREKWKNETVMVNLWRTESKNDYDRLRPMAYPGTDVFLVCFSLVDSDSLNQVRLKWVPEIKLHCPSVPIVLAGTKLDLRTANCRCVSCNDGFAMAKKIGAVKFVECSSKSGENVKDVFDQCVQAVFCHDCKLHNEMKCKPCNRRLRLPKICQIF